MKTRSLILSSLLALGAQAQVITPEDSLAAGLTPSNSPTVLSGYGEFLVNYDARYQTAKSNLTRNILFFGHRFNKRISFFSEMELEDAGINQGNLTGTLSMEQLFIKFGIQPDLYLTAGLFIPRIGIINENHLPTTFHGNDRPYLETFLIPATWREIGISAYYRPRAVPGLNLSLALQNGLNGSRIGFGQGIANAKGGGNMSNTANIALTGAVLYYRGNFRIQASGYYGGSCGLTPRVADSLMLDSGPFGTPVWLSEANVQYNGPKGLEFKIMGAISGIPDAASLNRAYASNAPEKMYGAYAELGYDLIKPFQAQSNRRLVLFSRYEWMDLNAEIPQNGLENGILKQAYWITGLTYVPVQGISVKLNYTLRTTGTPNPALFVNPYPSALPYYTSNGFIQLGAGYSF